MKLITTKLETTTGEEVRGFIFKVNVYKDLDTGNYYANVPELIETTAEGETIDKLWWNLKIAIEENLEKTSCDIIREFVQTLEIPAGYMEE